MVSIACLLLPEPEVAVDFGMVEVAYGVEASSVVLAHVAVGTGYGVEVALAGNFKTADRKMHVVVGALEWNSTFLRGMIIIPSL